VRTVTHAINAVTATTMVAAATPRIRLLKTAVRVRSSCRMKE